METLMGMLLVGAAVAVVILAIPAAPGLMLTALCGGGVFFIIAGTIQGFKAFGDAFHGEERSPSPGGIVGELNQRDKYREYNNWGKYDRDAQRVVEDAARNVVEFYAEQYSEEEFAQRLDANAAVLALREAQSAARHESSHDLLNAYDHLCIAVGNNEALAEAAGVPDGIYLDKPAPEDDGYPELAAARGCALAVAFIAFVALILLGGIYFHYFGGVM